MKNGRGETELLILRLVHWTSDRGGEERTPCTQSLSGQSIPMWAEIVKADQFRLGLPSSKRAV